MSYKKKMVKDVLKADAELLFQVLTERAERRALVLTTNLPFSEWTSTAPVTRVRGAWRRNRGPR